ncbi:MAG: hypothetical protein IJX85_04485 [Lachnospiraceae bacterium]|nr:hypothetical protein [Lachnospiraceae bacterium]
MKKVLLTMMMISSLALAACGKAEETTKTDTTSEMNVDTKEESADLTGGVTEQVDTETEEAQQTNSAYVGKYLDYDNNDPNLIIEANGDGTYKVEIGVFRLAVFEDDDAILTDAGIEYESEEGTKGVITLEGNEAVVTVTESTWDLAPVGTVYRYYRPSTQ